MNVGSVFISHSSKEPDYAVAEALARSLEQVGLDVWWDKDRLEGGDLFPAEIVEAIIKQRAFLYILSPRSSQSKWCLRELARADELAKEIIPLKLEQVPAGEQPLQLAGLQYVPVGAGVSNSLDNILTALGLGLRSKFQPPHDPFARDALLIQTLANQLNYAKTFTDALNLVLLLKSIGEAICETDRARNLLQGMLSRAHYSGGRISYDKVRDSLLTGWFKG
jgi:hypothetical protein